MLTVGTIRLFQLSMTYENMDSAIAENSSPFESEIFKSIGHTESNKLLGSYKHKAQFNTSACICFLPPIPSTMLLLSEQQILLQEVQENT